MATQSLRVRARPRNIVTALSLSAGQQYVVQNTGRSAVFISEGADPAERGLVIGRNQWWIVDVKTDPLWVWAGANADAWVTVNEAEG